MDSAERLLKLLGLLEGRIDWTAEELGRRLEVTTRTVRRDITRLRDLGYPVEAVAGPGGGYRLGAGGKLPPLLLDDEEALAVALGLRVATTAAVGGLEDASLSALSKLEHVLPPRLRSRLEDVSVATISTTGRSSTRVDHTSLATTASAIRTGVRLRFDYTDGEGRRSERHTEPHRLVHTGRRWYLVAFDLDRDDWRIFRVDRMTLRTGSGPRFVRREVPGGDVAAFVGARMSGPPSPVHGEMVLHARAADVAPWIGAQGLCEPLPDVDGAPRCRVVLGSWSWGGLAGRLGVFDVPFEVVGPPELVEATRELAGRYTAAVPDRRPQG
jgi:biotin operon repressor